MLSFIYKINGGSLPFEASLLRWSVGRPAKAVAWAKLGKSLNAWVGCPTNYLVTPNSCQIELNCDVYFLPAYVCIIY